MHVVDNGRNKESLREVGVLLKKTSGHCSSKKRKERNEIFFSKIRGGRKACVCRRYVGQLLVTGVTRGFFSNSTHNLP